MDRELIDHETGHETNTSHSIARPCSVPLNLSLYYNSPAASQTSGRSPVTASFEGPTTAAVYTPFRVSDLLIRPFFDTVISLWLGRNESAATPG